MASRRSCRPPTPGPSFPAVAARARKTQPQVPARPCSMTSRREPLHLDVEAEVAVAEAAVAVAGMPIRSLLALIPRTVGDRTYSRVFPRHTGGCRDGRYPQVDPPSCRLARSARRMVRHADRRGPSLTGWHRQRWPHRAPGCVGRSVATFAVETAVGRPGLAREHGAPGPGLNRTRRGSCTLWAAASPSHPTPSWPSLHR